MAAPAQRARRNFFTPMADTIPEHYTTEFSENWMPRAQQTKSRLSDFIVWKDHRGERKRFDRTAAQTSRRKNERKAATIAVNPTLDFRWISRYTLELVNDLDEDDDENLGELILPTGRWTTDHLSAYGRDMDDVTCAAALGTVLTGEDGDTQTAFSATYQIAAGGTGLTVAKLMLANEILIDADLEGAEMGSDGKPNANNRVLVCTAQQITNLLSDPQVTSADYNTVKALSDGLVDTYMGFTFRINKRLTKSSTTRSCVAWTKGAMIASKGKMTSRIATIHTQSDAIQVRSTWRLGAARMHDEGVVQIDCTERS